MLIELMKESYEQIFLGAALSVAAQCDENPPDTKVRVSSGKSGYMMRLYSDG